MVTITCPHGCQVPIGQTPGEHCEIHKCWRCNHKWLDGWGTHICFQEPGHGGVHRCMCDATKKE